ncbi:MAG TPA: hypothetical protein VI981_03450 [Candidatus Paceibacterota bacterium]
MEIISTSEERVEAEGLHVVRTPFEYETNKVSALMSHLAIFNATGTMWRENNRSST